MVSLLPSSQTGTHVFVVQVERNTTNSLSLAGVNRLCKHFTPRIDIFKQPRKQRQSGSGLHCELHSGDLCLLTSTVAEGQVYLHLL